MSPAGVEPDPVRIAAIVRVLSLLRHHHQGVAGLLHMNRLRALGERDRTPSKTLG
jgi:hypothetical protein